MLDQALARTCCSFCAAKNRAECHYRQRQPRSRPPAAGASRWTSSSPERNPGHDNGAPKARSKPSSAGRSFWRTGSDIAAPAASRAGDARELSLVLPLKRLEKRLSLLGGNRTLRRPRVYVCMPNWTLRRVDDQSLNFDVLVDRAKLDALPLLVHRRRSSVNALARSQGHMQPASCTCASLV